MAAPLVHGMRSDLSLNAGVVVSSVNIFFHGHWVFSPVKDTVLDVIDMVSFFWHYIWCANFLMANKKRRKLQWVGVGFRVSPLNLARVLNEMKMISLYILRGYFTIFILATSKLPISKIYLQVVWCSHWVSGFCS